MKIELENAVVYQGSNLDVLPTLPDNSVDSIVTDPPYELGFMGKSWDNSGIAYSVELWTECMRVLKPGGHLLAFGGSRTWHRLAVAIEDAGFEMRDSIAWLYGSGFPKSMDVAKAIQKASGVQPIDAIENKDGRFYGEGYNATPRQLIMPEIEGEAKKWEGWGTALKPAFEPVVVARKPLEEKTVAANVLKFGTGGLNIDGSRIGSGTGETKTVHYPDIRGGNYGQDSESYADRNTVAKEVKDQGRWPANVILGHTPDCQATGKTITNKTGAGNRTATFGTQDTKSGGDGSGGWSGYEYQTEVYACVDGCPVKLLDEQSGQTKSQVTNFKVKGRSGGILGKEGADRDYVGGHADSGGASRFFYVAKASKKDRNEGLDDLEGKEIGAKGNGLARTCSTCGSSVLDGCDCPDRTFVNPERKNFHPTVKPTSLMEYLIKLVTPPNGTVLDPFTGSGSTGKAALLSGFKFVGIELTEEYLPIIEARLKWASEQVNKETNEVLF